MCSTPTLEFRIASVMIWSKEQGRRVAVKKDPAHLPLSIPHSVTLGALSSMALVNPATLLKPHVDPPVQESQLSHAAPKVQTDQ